MGSRSRRKPLPTNVASAAQDWFGSPTVSRDRSRSSTARRRAASSLADGTNASRPTVLDGGRSPTAYALRAGAETRTKAGEVRSRRRPAGPNGSGLTQPRRVEPEDASRAQHVGDRLAHTPSAHEIEHTRRCARNPRRPLSRPSPSSSRPSSRRASSQVLSWCALSTPKLRVSDHADLPHPALDLRRPVCDEPVLAVEPLCARVRVGHPQRHRLLGVDDSL